MSSGSTAIKRRRLYQDVVDHLATLIHEGVYQPGQELPSERNLMQELKVGRPAIREALFALQKMGLVALRAGERPKVIEPSHDVVLETIRGPIERMMHQPDGLLHFQRARLFFEVGVVREAATSATAADLQQLEAALVANKESIGMVSRFERTDVDFHLSLARIPKNPIFEAIHDAMFDWLYEQRKITLQVPNQIQIAYREHEEIFNAIRDCNPDRAERAMRAHLARGHSLYWSIMKRGEVSELAPAEATHPDTSRASDD